MRTCLNCGSNETYLQFGKYPMWRKYEDGFLCKKCHNRLIDDPKYNPLNHQKWNPINNPKYNQRVIRFKDKRILLKENPRTGICQQCGAVKGVDCKRTHIHHKQYHENEPLKDTIELCVSCHTKNHNMMEAIRI